MAPVLAPVLAFLLATQATLLQIRIVEGESAVHAVGSRGAGLTVEITDEVGRPVSGAVVSLRLPDNGPAGVFANGMATEIVVTGSDGRAATTPIRWNRVAGHLQIRITAVRDRLRAGTVVSQYLNDPGAKGAAPVAPTEARSKGRSKWMKVALIAAAAGVGFATGMATRGGKSAAEAPPASSVQIGSPTITLSKP
jgi:hypothetical protein